MSSLLKNGLFILTLVLLVGFAYLTLFSQDKGALLSSSSAAATGQAALETQEFLRKLQDLEVVKIDTSIFSDSRFSGLKDFRKDLIDEPTGRQNPFFPTR